MKNQALHPAWKDVDDADAKDAITTQSRLFRLRACDTVDFGKNARLHHMRLFGSPEWANPFRADAHGLQCARKDLTDSSRLHELVRNGGRPLEARGKVSQAGCHTHDDLFGATRLQDGNISEPSHGVIRSLQFHPNGKLLLTAGLDKSIRLFYVDGIRNSKVRGVFLEDFPIHKSCFSGDGLKIVAAARRNYFYIYDLQHGTIERSSALLSSEERSLESFVQTTAEADQPLLAFLGQDGHIPLVSLKSMTTVGSVKMNGSSRAGVFSSDGRRLMTAGGDGVIYVWDLRNQSRCVEKIVDEPSTKITSLAMSKMHLVVGSDTGVVNIYDNPLENHRVKETNEGMENSWNGMQQVARRKRRCMINSLTTEVDNMAFSGNGEILAVSSRFKRDSLRLIHTPTYRVFANFPSSKSPLNYVWTACFSPSGAYFAVGNARGRALLYRIHAFSI
jgi:U3 small nucleolar RNA-associated protein 18